MGRRIRAIAYGGTAREVAVPTVRQRDHAVARQLPVRWRPRLPGERRGAGLPPGGRPVLRGAVRGRARLRRAGPGGAASRRTAAMGDLPSDERVGAAAAEVPE